MEYDTTLAVEAYDLAVRWDAARATDASSLPFSKDDLSKLDSNQISASPSRPPQSLFSYGFSDCMQSSSSSASKPTHPSPHTSPTTLALSTPSPPPRTPRFALASTLSFSPTPLRLPRSITLAKLLSGWLVRTGQVLKVA